MSEITAELTQEERLEAIGKVVAERDEIFDKINPKDPEYLKKLHGDLEGWKTDEQRETETIGDFLRWRDMRKALC